MRLAASMTAVLLVFAITFTAFGQVSAPGFGNVCIIATPLAGCSHVLHSTGQLYPHKRKHERRENELAYRKYRLAQATHQRAANGGTNGSSAFNFDIPIHEVRSFRSSFLLTRSLLSQTFDHLPEDDSTLDTLAAQLPLAQVSAIPIEDILGEIVESRYLKYIHRQVFVHPLFELAVFLFAHLARH